MEKGFTPVFYLWVVTAFMVTRTVVMPTIGWVSAVAGSRTFYLVELLINIVGSVLCGLSSSVSSLVFFRVSQALGAGRADLGVQ